MNYGSVLHKDSQFIIVIALNRFISKVSHFSMENPLPLNAFRRKKQKIKLKTNVFVFLH